MTSYNMGQYRFSSSDSYKTEISIPNSAIGYYLKTSKHEFTENDSNDNGNQYLDSNIKIEAHFKLDNKKVKKESILNLKMI